MMRSFIIASVVFLGLSSSAQAGDDEAPAVGSQSWMRARLESCLVHVGEGDYPAGEACYRDAASALAAEPDASADDVALLRELARMSAALAMPKTPPRPRPDVVVDLSPEQTLEAVGATEEASLPPAGNRVADFTFSGRTELVLTSTLFGGYLGVLTAAEGAFLRASMGYYYGTSSLDAIPVLLLPLVLGGGGLVAAGAPALLWEGMSPGDAHLLRSAELLGAANSLSFLAFNLIRSSKGTPIHRDATVNAHLVTLGMGSLAVMPLVPAIAAAYFVDVPEGGPSLGMSAAALAAVVSVLGFLAADVELDLEVMLGTAVATSNLAFLGGLAASYAVPVSRVETWAIDLGGFVGFLGAAALAFAVPAPSPVLGWGGMAAGTVVGSALGFGAAKAIPFAVDAIDVDSVLGLSPLVLAPMRQDEAPPVGMLVTVDTSAFER